MSVCLHTWFHVAVEVSVLVHECQPHQNLERHVTHARLAKGTSTRLHQLVQVALLLRFRGQCKKGTSDLTTACRCSGMAVMIVLVPYQYAQTKHPAAEQLWVCSRQFVH